jgi:3-oxoacyl-[acyl-carrier-protein] synthase II
LITQGRSDCVLAGGVDALSQIAFTGFYRLLAMAPEQCQPFDLERKGMMLGEGAGVLVLESLERAQKRNATIYAEILGYGLSCDASSMTASNADEIQKATLRAFSSAKLNSKDVDYISAHGTGTKENDKEECRAFIDVFGKRAKEIPVSSIKAMLGHTMGAAAAIEAISCCLAIKDGKIPPTINYKAKDPACDIDCVPNRMRKQKVKIALNSSQAFGGNNACLILKSYS